jgi:hypothetical protein
MRMRPAAAVLLVVAVLAGCSSGGSEPPEAAAFDDVPVGEAVIEPAGRTLVPADPPDGFIPQIVDRETDRYSPGSARLYGRPGDLDPDAGPLLLVVWQQPESDGALPGAYEPPNTVSGGEGDVRWITWGVPNDYSDPDSVGVVGRGVSERDLQRAADSLVLDPPVVEESVPRTASVSELPEGFVELASGPVTLSEFHFSGEPRGGSMVEWSDGDRSMVVATYEHDDALALLLRTAVDDPGGTVIRGQPGAHGPQLVPVHNQWDGLVWTWTEDGADVVVITRAMEEDLAREVIESLRWSSDWDGLAAQASEPLDVPAAANKIVLRGGFPGGSWNWGIEAHPDDGEPGGFRFSDMVDIRHVDGSHGAGGGGSMVSDHASFTIAGDELGTLFLGTVPAAAERVELELADGTVLEPELRGHPDGWVIEAWAVWVDEREVVATDVRAVDAAGTDLLVDAPAQLAAMGQPVMPGGSTGTGIATS